MVLPGMSATVPPAPLQLAVLIPLRDDWASAAQLLRALDSSLASASCVAHVFLVDDGSVSPCPHADFSGYAALRSIRLLHLRCNLGHQRAIATGLVHIHATFPCDAVLVMDGDGEDTAEGALRLVEAYTGQACLFARRTGRNESFAFQFCYRLFKPAFRLLTGIPIGIGNFSLLPASYIGALAAMPELWTHYAATALRSDLPLVQVPLARGHRIAGQSKMNFLSLAIHGLRAISVFADRVAARILACLGVAWLLAFTAFAAMAIRAGLLHLPTSASTVWALGDLAGLITLLLATALAFALHFLSGRPSFAFIPLRDAAFFLAEERALFASTQPASR